MEACIAPSLWPAPQLNPFPLEKAHDVTLESGKMTATLKTRGQTSPLGPAHRQPFKSALVPANASSPHTVPKVGPGDLPTAQPPQWLRMSSAQCPALLWWSMVSSHFTALLSLSRIGGYSQPAQPLQASAKTLGCSQWVQPAPQGPPPNPTLRCPWSFSYVSTTVLGTGDAVADRTDVVLALLALALSGTEIALPMTQLIVNVLL